jgi:hypothetical protein
MCFLILAEVVLGFVQLRYIHWFELIDQGTHGFLWSVSQAPNRLGFLLKVLVPMV